MRNNPQHFFGINKAADILRYYDSEGLLDWIIIFGWA